MRHLSKFLPLVLTLALLQGCGGGSSASTQYTFRLVNATSSPLDMVDGGTILASGIAYGTASNNVTLASGTYKIEFEDTGSGIPTSEINSSFATGTPYTLLAYTSAQSLHIAQLVENEPAPASGDGKIRIVDLSADAGNVAVYMSVQGPTDDTYNPNTPSAALSAASLFGGLQNFSGTSSYFELPKNTYHIWVTGTGDKNDLRLDIPSIVLSDQQLLTLVLTGTTGGVLVDGLLVTQQGAVVAQQNTNARIRIAANTTSALASAKAGGIDLLGGALSFNSTIGYYVLVPAGSTSIAESSGTCANNLPVPVSTIPTTPGEDLTLLVTASTCTVLVDDNTRPTSGNYAKLRLVNGINGGGSISLTDNDQSIASNVALGTASDPTVNNQGIVSISNLSNDLMVSTSPAFSIPSASLVPQGIYSLFMLGSSSAATGLLVKDN